MTPEIRRAALRMAAKTALVMSLGGIGALGCSGSGKGKPTGPGNTGSGSAATSDQACPDYLDGLATAKMDELPAGDPLKDKPGVYGAFADRTARESAKTKECCTNELVTDGSGAKHRWECCSALGDVPAGADGTACTPWGPPCPPEMPLFA